MECQEGICTLCLEKCESCRAVEENTKNVLCSLLPKMDFNIIQQGQGICSNCAEMLIECFDFKTKCLYTYKSIFPLVNNSVKLDLKDVYLSKNATGTGILEDQDICGFCMNLVKKVCAVSLDVEDGGIMLDKMIKRCLPELDLSVIKKPVICTPCHGSLGDCFHFVTNCLNAEEKMKYCETLAINSKEEIDLSGVLQFTIRDIKSEVYGNSVDKIKVEQQFCENIKSPDEREIHNGRNIIKLEDTFRDDCQYGNKDVEIKNEIFLTMDDQKDDSEHQFTPRNMLALEEESYSLGLIKTEGLYCERNETEHKEENLVEMEDQKFLPNEEIEIKTEENNFIRFEDSIVLPQHEVTTSFNRKQTFSMPNLKKDLNKSYIKQTLTNKNVSVKTMYECDFCSHQTKYKHIFKAHFLTHKDPAEVIMYKCASCLYQTKHKRNLKLHLLRHKDASEVTMYKCDVCLYQTKHKRTLKIHLLRHKDPSEVTMHKCGSCLYQTIHKHSLKKHLLNHKDVSEVTMYKCDVCLYQTKHKRSLKMHLLKHKDPSEVTMYECDTCLYQTNRKDNLKKHLLKHKDPSEVTMYKCDVCLYQTKFSNSLKIHLLKHKDPSEVTMYNCDSCLYQTKFKSNLNTHLLTHKDPSELTTYKCDFCLYQTKFKSSLAIHLQKHKDPSEVEVTSTYKCDSCSYQTKFKGNLKMHLLSHKDPSEVTMYKCDSCLFQTKYQKCIKRHLLKHKDPSE